MPLTRRQLLGAAAAAFAAAAPPHAHATPGWPARPVRLIVPNMPGGGIDILARHLQEPLAAAWGQPVVVEYKPGANTLLGTDHVAKSAPDGHTLGMTVSSHVINPALRRSMPYDTTRDLCGVAIVSRFSLMLSATPDLPVRDLAELIAHVRAHPNRYTYASPGAGSLTHLAVEQLKQVTGMVMEHVPYKGSAGAYTDVSGGRVQLLSDPLFSSMPHVQAGRLKAIAVLGPRDATAPAVPPVGDTLPGWDEVTGMSGLVAPAATPRAIVSRISADVVAALQSAELRERFTKIGIEPVGSTPEAYDALIRRDLERWRRVVREGRLPLID